jgi:hypothetical protein
MRWVWVVIPLVLFGIVGIQEADALAPCYGNPILDKNVITILGTYQYSGAIHTALGGHEPRDYTTHTFHVDKVLFGEIEDENLIMVGGGWGAEILEEGIQYQVSVIKKNDHYAGDWCLQSILEVNDGLHNRNLITLTKFDPYTENQNILDSFDVKIIATEKKGLKKYEAIGKINDALDYDSLVIVGNVDFQNKSIERIPSLYGFRTVSPTIVDGMFNFTVTTAPPSFKYINFIRIILEDQGNVIGQEIAFVTDFNNNIVEVLPNNNPCENELVPITKNSFKNWSLNCVTADTKSKLIERGWGLEWR